MTQFDPTAVRREHPAAGAAQTGWRRHWWALLAAVLCLVAAAHPGSAHLAVGSQAPPFVLAAVDGSEHTLSPGSGAFLQILYFFDADSEACRHGLQFLADLKARLPADRLRVWALTRSPRARVAALGLAQGPELSVLLDNARVSELYQAATVLPVTYVLSSDLEIITVLVGGGGGQQVRLERLAAERCGRLPGAGAEDPVDAMRRQGIELFTQKDYARAEAVLGQAIARRPDATSYLYLAYTQMELDKKTELGLTLRQAIVLFPEEIRLHRIYAKYLIDLGDRAGALKLLDQALAIEPDDINLKMLKDVVAGGRAEQPLAATGGR